MRKPFSRLEVSSHRNVWKLEFYHLQLICPYTRKSPPRLSEVGRSFCERRLEAEFCAELKCPRATRAEDAARRGYRLAEGRRVQGVRCVRNKGIEIARVVGGRHTQDIGVVEEIEDLAESFD